MGGSVMTEDRLEKLRALVDKVKNGGATLSINKAREIREEISGNHKPNDTVLVVRNSGKIKEVLGFKNNSLAREIEKYRN